MSDTNDIRERMQECGRYIATILPPHTGFIFLAFDFGPGGRMEYIANAKRDDVVEAMREFIKQIENPDDFCRHVPDKLPMKSAGDLATELQAAIHKEGYGIDRRDLIDLLQRKGKNV